MSCEFINNRTGVQCNNQQLDNSKYCKKHKRYEYGQSKRADDDQSTTDENVTLSNTTTVNNNERIGRLDDELNNNVDLNIIKQMNEQNDLITIDDEQPGEQQIVKQDGEQPASKTIDDAMHDPEIISDIMYGFIVAGSNLVEKVSQMTKDKTKVVVKGLVQETVKKETEYKKLLKYAYLENSEDIDKLVTPGKAIALHFASSIASCVQPDTGNDF